MSSQSIEMFNLLHRMYQAHMNFRTYYIRNTPCHNETHPKISSKESVCWLYCCSFGNCIRRTLTDALPIIHWFSSYTLHIRAVRFVYSFSYCSNIGLRWNGKICDVFERSFSKKYFHTGYNCYSFILFLDTDFEHNWMRQFMYLNHQ